MSSNWDRFKEKIKDIIVRACRDSELYWTEGVVVSGLMNVDRVFDEFINDPANKCDHEKELEDTKRALKERDKEIEELAGDQYWQVYVKTKIENEKLRYDNNHLRHDIDLLKTMLANALKDKDLVVDKFEDIQSENSHLVGLLQKINSDTAGALNGRLNGNT